MNRIVGTLNTTYFISCQVWSTTRQSMKTVETFRKSRILVMLEYWLLSEVRLRSMEPGRMGTSWMTLSRQIWWILKVNIPNKQEQPKLVGRIVSQGPITMCFFNVQMSEGSRAVMAEWLRRWTRNPMGFPRAGSNPADYGMFPLWWFLLGHSQFRRMLLPWSFPILLFMVARWKAPHCTPTIMLKILF